MLTIAYFSTNGLPSSLVGFVTAKVQKVSSSIKLKYTDKTMSRHIRVKSFSVCRVPALEIVVLCSRTKFRLLWVSFFLKVRCVDIQFLLSLLGILVCAHR